MWLIILIVIVSLTYLYSINPYSYWKTKGVQITSKPWPLLGQLWPNVLRQCSIIEIVDYHYKAFPNERYIGFYNMANPALIIRDPELIKTITVKEFDTFPEHKPFIAEDTDPLWSKNLFAMKGGKKWREMRATLSPSFTSSKMRMMFELMKTCTTQFSEYFLKQEKMITVEMKDTFTRFTNDVIATTAFGVTCNSLEDRENDFFVMGKEATDFSGIKGLLFLILNISPKLAKILKIRMFAKTVDTFFRSIIKETVAFREKHNVVRPDMLHLLMEARKGRLKHEADEVDSGFAVVQESEIGKVIKTQKIEITDEDMTAQALIFFFAGFDTVSTMMCYACYELAINPHIQEKLRQEVDEVLDKSKGIFTYDNILGMRYLDLIISETLRKWPPFILIDRLSVKPFTIEPQNPHETSLHLEEGSAVTLPIYSIHRDPKYYPEPDKFDPERFNEENKHKIKLGTYLPFGMGPRNCIGSRFALLEGKLIVAEMISKFEIVTVEKTQIPIVHSKSKFTPLPDEGIWLGLKPRKSFKLNNLHLE